jgi:hypothetical protein
MNRNCHVFANCCWEILPPLLLANNGYLGISQQLSATLLAVLSGCPTAFKSISQQLSAETWQFPSLFSEGPCFCYRLLKVEGAFKNLKNHQRLLYWDKSVQQHNF